MPCRARAGVIPAPLISPTILERNKTTPPVRATPYSRQHVQPPARLSRPFGRFEHDSGTIPAQPATLGVLLRTLHGSHWYSIAEHRSP